jgi:hypothetical protein
MTTLREMQAGAPQGSVLFPSLYNIYVNDPPLQIQEIHLALFADKTCLNATVRRDRFNVTKLQRATSSMEAWCESWNIIITEDKTQGIYSRSRRPPVSHFTLKRKTIPYLNGMHPVVYIYVKIYRE